MSSLAIVRLSVMMLTAESRKQHCSRSNGSIYRKCGHLYTCDLIRDCDLRAEIAAARYDFAKTVIFLERRSNTMLAIPLVQIQGQGHFTKPASTRHPNDYPATNTVEQDDISLFLTRIRRVLRCLFFLHNCELRRIWLDGERISLGRVSFYFPGPV